ncbi:MAG: VOC family protein [Ilumatobacteraceae bacterium]
MTCLDHLVYAAPDLDSAVAAFAAATGVIPEVGGSHTDLGTRNALVTLGDSYLELIGPDPGQPEPAVARPFGIDELDGPRFVAIGLRPDLGQSIVELVKAARLVGFDLGEAFAMQRRGPDGIQLHWRLTMPRLDLGPGVPFLIDWGDTPMPSGTIGPKAELVELQVTDRRSDTIRSLHAALGSEIVVLDVADRTPPAIRATIRGPRGAFSG